MFARLAQLRPGSGAGTFREGRDFPGISAETVYDFRLNSENSGNPSESLRKSFGIPGQIVKHTRGQILCQILGPSGAILASQKAGQIEEKGRSGAPRGPLRGAPKKLPGGASGALRGRSGNSPGALRGAPGVALVALANQRGSAFSRPPKRDQGKPKKNKKWPKRRQT